MISPSQGTSVVRSFSQRVIDRRSQNNPSLCALERSFGKKRMYRIMHPDTPNHNGATKGNSRTTRVLTFHILRSKNIPIIDIPLGLLEAYLDVTKAYKKREDKDLMGVLQKIILYNLKSINEQLRY